MIIRKLNLDGMNEEKNWEFKKPARERLLIFFIALGLVSIITCISLIDVNSDKEDEIRVLKFKNFKQELLIDSLKVRLAMTKTDDSLILNTNLK